MDRLMRLVRALVVPVVSLLAVAGAAAECAAGPEFRVSFDRGARQAPATGRLVVYLVKANSPVDLSGQSPGEGPFFESPQPMYGVDVRDLPPGKSATVGDGATFFPVKLSSLPAGRYKAQAVLDVNRLDSSWKREPGNLYSRVRVFDVKSGLSETIDLALTEVVKAPSEQTSRASEVVEVPSELLTKFRGYPVTMKATVTLPTGYDGSGSKKYAAVYEIPGFGGDHRQRMGMRGGNAELLAEAAWITLNPEGPNGHHLFANSANNGPVGDALVQEMIPALEKKYRLVGESWARLLRGHSSGGWSSIWLAITYPETFGGAWSSSPDPVDFEHFQMPSIYRDESMYAPAGKVKDSSAATDTPSFRDTGDTRMTIRQENRMEEVLGPGNTSGQQWDSWMAVFGPRGKEGNPAALYDPETGVIDRAVAESYRKYDITDLVRREPGRYGKLIRERVRLVVGGEDSYFLEGAVASLKEELARDDAATRPSGKENGYITIVPGRDHGTIFATQELRAFPREMLEHIRAHKR